MQVPSPGHDTEASELYIAPAGFGLGWMVQPVARGRADAEPARERDMTTTTTGIDLERRI
jgi:hypothetical protein